MKPLQLRSKSSIEIEVCEMLDAVNGLRREYASGRKNKAPLGIERVLSKLRLFEARDADRGMLSFSIRYRDQDYGSCVRNFPNFGLDVISKSTIEHRDDMLHLSVDLIVRAGKAKWQRDELGECTAILESGAYAVSLLVTLDEKSDWAGHSTCVPTRADKHDTVGIPAIPSTYFLINERIP